MWAVEATSFAQWREQARALLAQNVPPEQVSWNATADNDLFGATAAPALPPTRRRVKVPAQALALFEQAARYRSEDRWALLYQVLWRVAGGDRAALLAGDRDGSRLQQRVRAVQREIHHLHAFVRFQPRPAAGEEEPELVAWIEPAHDVLDAVGEHFCQRLGRLRWLIATPEDGLLHDGRQLHYRRPCPEQWQRWAQAGGEESALWQQYYRSIFNPARVNPEVLRGHLPLRFWRQVPEGELIPQLVKDARLGGRRYGQRETVAQQRGKTIAARPASEDQAL